MSESQGAEEAGGGQERVNVEIGEQKGFSSQDSESKMHDPVSKYIYLCVARGDGREGRGIKDSMTFKGRKSRVGDAQRLCIMKKRRTR